MPSTILTWTPSGLGTKTGTATADLFSDLKALIDSHAADSAFLWEVKASSLTTPFYLSIGRKAASAGRILIVAYASNTNGNTKIFDTTANANVVFLSWFPNATTDTPGNLATTTGDVYDNDTGAVKASSLGLSTAIYAASYQPFYFESQECMFFGFQREFASSFGGGAGLLLVDLSDNAIGATWGSGSANSQRLDLMAVNTATTNPLFFENAGLDSGGTGARGGRVDESGVSRYFNGGLIPSGNWLTATAANNLLLDQGEAKSFFVPIPLLRAGVKGGGFWARFRQIAHGPPNAVAFELYQADLGAGVVDAARHFCAAASQSQAPWMTNFKLP